LNKDFESTVRLLEAAGLVIWRGGGGGSSAKGG
jgi:hypothetical protein